MGRKPTLKIKVSEHVKVTTDLWYKHFKHKPTGGKKILGQGKVGTELHHDSNTYQYRRRQFKFSDPTAPDSYEEEISNPILGYYKNIKERLVDHMGHGSAKQETDIRINRKVAEIAGWYGTIAIVLAYILVSFKAVPANGVVYQLLNLTGALGIITISVVKRVRQPAILNIFWALIAAVALIAFAIH